MVKYILTNNKCQAWGIDLTVAVTIFLIGVFSIYLFAINFYGGAEETLNKLAHEGNFASSLILSEGDPIYWNENNVRIPGLLNEQKINQTKLEIFYNLSNENYRGLANKLGIDANNNFYFNFTRMEIDGNEIPGIGKKPVDAKNIIRIERFTTYKNSPTKLNMYIWN